MKRQRSDFATLQNYKKKSRSTDCSEIVVGIDLGTINISVACYSNKLIKILKTFDGNVVPSLVYFYEFKIDQAVVGSQAIIEVHEENAENGVNEIKRLIGQDFDNEDFQSNLQNLLYTVQDERNEPIIVIAQPDDEFLVKTPVEVYSLLLLQIKYNIEETLGNLNKIKAVITVPAHFNIRQREDTLEAAERAGFEILQLLSEPTAIALRYFFNNRKINKNRYYLVCNVGGGTFDVAILRKIRRNIETVAVAGDTFLGGQDFDNVLVNHVCDVLISEYNFNVKLDKTILRKVHCLCEQAKNNLSYLEEVEIKLNGIIPNIELCTISVTKLQFEILADTLFKKLTKILDSLFTESALTKTSMRKVILYGGATKIPKIQELFEDYFGITKIKYFNSSNYSAAKGAAIQAAMLSKSREQKISKMTVRDVTPVSIKINDSENLMYEIIDRNTLIPLKKIVEFSTVENDQITFAFDVYQSETSANEKDFCLKRLELIDITPAPAGECKIFIEITIDQNGILKISATETVKDCTKELKLVHRIEFESDDQLEDNLEDIQDNNEETEEQPNPITKYLQFSKTLVNSVKSKKPIKKVESLNNVTLTYVII